jgi:hypothetical protein
MVHTLAYSFGTNILWLGLFHDSLTKEIKEFIEELLQTTSNFVWYIDVTFPWAREISMTSTLFVS